MDVVVTIPKAEKEIRGVEVNTAVELESLWLSTQQYIFDPVQPSHNFECLERKRQQSQVGPNLNLPSSARQQTGRDFRNVIPPRPTRMIWSFGQQAIQTVTKFTRELTAMAPGKETVTDNACTPSRDGRAMEIQLATQPSKMSRGRSDNLLTGLDRKPDKNAAGSASFKSMLKDGGP